MDKQRLTEAVTQYQSGDEAAFNTIYELTSSNLYVYAKSLMKDPHRAEDLLQNTYMQIIRNIGRLQAPGAFLTWSKRIMHNQYVDSVRGSHGETVATSEEALLMFDEVVEEDREALPEENYDVQQVGEIVWEVMEQMPPEQRMVMMAFYRDEMTVAEIAAMMDLPENTVKSRLFYGRKAMKAHLEDYERKHDIRLHSLVPGPIIGMALQNQVPAGYGLPFDQSVPLLHRILDSVSQSAAQAAQGSASAGGVQGSSSAGTSAGTTTGGASAGGATSGSTAAGSATGSAAGTAAASLGGGKIAALVIAGALAVGGAGFGIHHMLNDQNDGTAEQTQTTETTQQATEAEPESGTLTDADYPKMIAGDLTKDETELFIAYTHSYASNFVGDEENISQETIRESVYASEDTPLTIYSSMTDEYTLEDGLYTFPLDNLNRYMSCWGFDLYETNKTYNDSEDVKCWTDDKNLYLEAQWGDWLSEPAAKITSAEYTKDTLRIQYDLSEYDLVEETNKELGTFTANFRKSAGGKYVLDSFEKE